MAGDVKGSQSRMHATAKDMTNGIKGVGNNVRGADGTAAGGDGPEDGSIRAAENLSPRRCPKLLVAQVENSANEGEATTRCLPHVIADIGHGNGINRFLRCVEGEILTRAIKQVGGMSLQILNNAATEVPEEVTCFWGGVTAKVATGPRRGVARPSGKG